MTTALNGRVESCPCRPRAPERTVVLLSAACNSEVELADIPLRLFEEAICAGLVNSKDVLVRRLKRAVESPLSKKYADDVANIVYCIKNCQNLPRVLLKNGKRSAHLQVVISKKAYSVYKSSDCFKCVCVRLSVPRFLPPRATTQQNSYTNGISAALA